MDFGYEPLRMMLRLLGEEYSPRDVAIAAFDMLNPEDAKELISRLSPEEPEQEFYEISLMDLGKSHIYAWGARWSVEDLMGTIQKIDVGKRIVKVPLLTGRNILQVESARQRDKREART